MRRVTVGPAVRLGTGTATSIPLTETETESSVSINPTVTTIIYGDEMYYKHVQTVPAGEWIIQHNLGLKPNITVYSASGEEVGMPVQQIDNNTAHVIWPAPAAGFAICS